MIDEKTGRRLTEQESYERKLQEIARSPHARAAAAFLASEAGASLMAALSKQFDRDELAGQHGDGMTRALDTHRNLGRRDVLRYLRNLAALKERTGEDDA